MKQYKDELLASCLNFLLSLPHDIIMLDIKAYIPALQVGQSDVQLILFFTKTRKKILEQSWYPVEQLR